MKSANPVLSTQTTANVVPETVFTLLFAVAFSHFLNDLIQALLPAIYPILKKSYQLTFAQLGLITFAFQVTSSILQPLVGLTLDRRSFPYSLAVGMGLSLVGLLSLAFAPNYPTILLAAALVGSGSAIFHPEASRVAFLAAGSRRGLAQSIFQTGGNLGGALGPVLAAAVVVPHGQHHLAWFSLVALVGVVVLWRVGRWHRRNLHRARPVRTPQNESGSTLSLVTVRSSLLILVALMFSKFVYLTSLSSYYTFYLIDRFHLSIRDSQFYLFLFLGSVALGTIVGGPIGDRIGRKQVIWVSILGVAPFTLWLPHASLALTAALSCLIGFVIASAFSAILVYAQELVPGKVGLISGLFFGLAFGIGGIGSAVLGKLADHRGIQFVFQVCAFLPLIGLLTIFLPQTRQLKRA
jgi:FSR family fosmidomycin resistance protein-like MFS transporter